MSSRNYTVGTTNSAFYMHEEASGTNGRSEVIEGFTRDKWNNYSMHRHTASAEPAENGNYSVTGKTVKVQDVSLWGPPDITNLAQARLLSRVRLHDFNLGVALAEGKQALDMTVNTAVKIANAAKYVRHGRISDAIRTLVNSDHERANTRESSSYHRVVRRLDDRDFFSKWIELQYGWLPLMSDVFEAWTAYHAIAAKHRKSEVRVKAKGSFPINDSGNGYPYYRVSGVLEYRERIQYEMSEILPIARQLGLYDPLSVSWEKIPFSFIADWFIPIGTYLENLNQIPALRGRFLVTKKWKYIGESTILPPGLSWNNIRGGSTKTYTFSLTRTVSSGLTAVSPSFKSLPDAMSPMHIANAISLLRMRFS